MLSFRHRSFARRAAATLGAALCVMATIAIWALVTGDLGEIGGRALASTFMAALCTLTALAGATVLEAGDARRWLGLATLVLSAAEFAVAFTTIWFGLDDAGLLRALGAISALLPAFVHASLMLGRLRPTDGRLVRRLTVAGVTLSMLSAVGVAGGVALAVGSPGAGAWRLLGVLVVLATLSTLLAPIVRRLAPAGGDAVRPESAGGEAGARPNRMTMFRRVVLVHRGHAA